MKSRDLGVYVAAGLLAGAVVAWSATRVARTATPPAQVPLETVATNAPAAPPAQSLESVPRISQADFSKRMERGEIVVIDVRDAADYTAAHIPGAMHIPLSFIQGELPYLPRGKPIVTYCT
ncbi:MAG TPA: rhodanese-like domain-containing protein [Thermoanaerobaculia bacterium]